MEMKTIGTHTLGEARPLRDQHRPTAGAGRAKGPATSPRRKQAPAAASAAAASFCSKRRSNRRIFALPLSCRLSCPCSRYCPLQLTTRSTRPKPRFPSILGS